ncbi:MAG: DUF2442 domain-containing protein [Deltaproteobacteria bacterium]|nr:DUF2442 domain-containing protein [Deltaproteobacteria bacterium]
MALLLPCIMTRCQPLEDYKLKIWFADGKSGIVDFATFIRKGGIFAKLAELENFKGFTVNRELGVITWCGEIDIAPETLYSEATQEPLPQWVEMAGLKRSACVSV